MSEQEIQIHTHTGHDGYAHFDVPVGIADRDIVVSISYSVAPSPQKKNSIDHLLGSIDSSDREQDSSTEDTAFGEAVIEKLANQGVELP